MLILHSKNRWKENLNILVFLQKAEENIIFWELVKTLLTQIYGKMRTPFHNLDNSFP